MFNTHRFFLQRYTVSKETIKISYLKNALNKPKAELWRSINALHSNSHLRW